MKRNQKTLFLSYLALFIGIELVLMFTPLGFIPLGVIRATTLHIPVIIAGIVLGRKGGMAVGLTFGLASVLINTLSPTITSFVFTPFYSLGDINGNFFSLVIAIVPRVLLGFFAAEGYRLFNKKLSFSTSIIIASLGSALLHSIMVLGGIFIFFGPQYAQVKELTVPLLPFLLGIIGTNGIVEAILGAFITVSVCVALKPSIRRLGGLYNG